MTSRLSVALATSLAICSGAVAADSYPSKPLHLIVAFPPGNASDGVARIVAQPLSQALGQPVLVENKPGADGAIAAEAVIKALPDGYTLFVATNTPVLGVPTLRKSPPYDPVKSFAGVSLLGRFSMFLYLHPSVPATTLAELIEYARANPGKLNYAASTATGTVSTAQLMTVAGIKLMQVPYKGEASAILDLVAGRVQVLASPTTAPLAHVKEGRLRVLATLLGQRSPLAPEVPTIAEAGMPSVSVVGWAGLFAPARVPREVAERLSREVNGILRRSDVREQLDRLGFEGQGSTPEELMAYLSDQLEVWRRIVRESGLAQE